MSRHSLRGKLHCPARRREPMDGPELFVLAMILLLLLA